MDARVIPGAPCVILGILSGVDILVDILRELWDKTGCLQ